MDSFITSAPALRARSGHPSDLTAQAQAATLERTLGNLAVRRYGLCVAFVLLLMALNVFAGLSSVSLNDSDEARYGVAAWEMLQHKSFILTTYAGQPEYWNLKPPLG